MSDELTPFERAKLPTFEPLDAQENIDATNRVMSAIARYPQTFAGSSILSAEAVEMTDPDLVRPGHITIRGLEQFDPAPVDFMPRLNKIHKSFDIVKADGSPVEVPRPVAAMLIKGVGTKALVDIRRSMDKVGGMPIYRENDFIDAYQMHELLVGNADIREAVLAKLRPERETVLASSRTQVELARQLHQDREERRAETATYQAGVNIETPAEKERRFLGALGRLTSKLSRTR
jgi:hypothetical protein